YWWAFSLGLLGVLLLMGIFVKICSVHTPSSNPRRKPARSLSIKRTRVRTNAFITPPPLTASNGEHLNLQQSQLFVRQTSSENNPNRLNNQITNTARL
ncbi:unnamed protein product, partial [Didymodactylos carnosus]